MSHTEKPTILRQGKYSIRELRKLKAKPVWRVVDIYKSQLAELFEIDNPSLRLSADFNKQREAYILKEAGPKPELKGDWVYYPWSGLLIHMIDKNSYHRLRTNRNQKLISVDEQNKLAKFTVGVTGLSVGASIATALAYSGTSETIKLAERDTMETTNLNRVKSGLANINQPKLLIAAQQIYEINPYAQIEAFPEGLSKTNVEDFVGGAKPIDVVFDEIDDFEMKVRLRLAAKKAKTPLIMLTSLGDNILVDIERYDQSPQPAIFNGLLGKLSDEILNSKIGEKEKIKYAAAIVGEKYIPTRALESLLEINHSLVGRPQLFSTVTIASGLGVYLVRRLALGQQLPSGRSYISLEAALNLPSQKDENQRSDILRRLEELTQ